MWRTILSIIVLYVLCLHHASQIAADEKTSDPDNHFDTLVFSQQWPVTICKYWMDETGGQCVYPKQKNQWTVHGIWPRKVGVKYTEFCNSTGTFDPEEIKSLESDLQQAWCNVYKENDPYIFWSHEWLKHGACGTELEPLNSEFKYFSRGIEWNQKYSLSDMLDAAGIYPDDSKEWNPEEFVNAVKAKTGKSAMIGCYTIKEVVYVQELRICFDKQFNLIDCEQPAVDKDCFSSCYSTKGVIYPANAMP